MYIYILEKFIDIHNKTKVYSANTIEEVSESRYKEILKNMKKIKKNLIRKATEEEIKDFLKNTESDDNQENNNESAKEEVALENDKEMSDNNDK